MMSPKKLARIQKDHRLRREEILQAAASLFFKRGVLAATMADIARELQVAKSFLYYYFPSREDLLLSLLEEGWKSFLSIVESRDIPRSREGFLLLLRRLIEAYNAQPHLYGALFQLSPQAGSLFPTEKLKTVENLKKRAYTLIEKRLEEDWKVSDSSHLMRNIGGILFGYFRLGKEKKPISADEVLRIVEKLLPPSSP